MLVCIEIFLKVVDNWALLVAKVKKGQIDWKVPKSNYSHSYIYFFLSTIRKNLWQLCRNRKKTQTWPK
jgi:hypothetical protein